MITLFDTHAHLDQPEFDADRAEVMARAGQAGLTTRDCRYFYNVKKWAAFGVVVLAHAAFNMLLSPVGGPPSDSLWPVTTLGVLMMQPMLFAIWASLGPGPATFRVPLVLAVFILCVFAGCFKQWNLVPVRGLSPNMPDWRKVRVLEFADAAVPLILFVGTATIAGLAGRVSRCHIPSASDFSSAVSPKIQFSIRYLIGLMTVGAALVAVGGRITFDFSQPFADSTYLLLASIVYGCGFLFQLISAALVLSTNIATRRHALILLAAAIVSLATAGAIAMLNPSFFRETWPMLIVTEVMALVCGLVTALPLRWAGYRWASTTSRRAAGNNSSTAYD